jgi:hypothetical protein
MSNAIAGELTDVAIEVARDDVLAVTVFSDHGISHEYVSDSFDEETREVEMDSLRRPLQNVQKSLGTLADVNPMGGGHQGSYHFYDDIIHLHIPVEEEMGVVISLAPESEHYEDVFSKCLAVVFE